MSDKISDARAALHAVLADENLPAERTHLYPQNGQYPTPCAWVGYPEARADAQRSKTLTLPVVYAFDGAKQAQQKQLDAETARLWDALEQVSVDGVRVRTTSSSIQALGPDGATTLAVVFSVAVVLTTPTFCGQSVAATP